MNSDNELINEYRGVHTLPEDQATLVRQRFYEWARQTAYMGVSRRHLQENPNKWKVLDAGLATWED